MLKRTIYASLLLATSVGFAQDIDRSRAPKPGPAPVINIADPAEFTLPNGLRVFVVTNTKLPQVSATLTLDRLPLAEGDKAGMLSMAGDLMRRGTTKMTKEKLDDEVDFLGGDLSASSTSVSASSLKQHFPKLMGLMADVALRPSFPADELEKIRRQKISAIAQAKESPDAIARNVSNVLMYGKKHPYGEIETEESVKKVTVADIRNYYNTWWKPNIAYLVLVGDITVDEARKLATQHFGAWKQGAVPKVSHPTVAKPTRPTVAIVDRPVAVQSVINIVAPADIKPGAPDAIPASVMNTVLGGGFSSRLIQNLREKYGFTYGAYSRLSNDRLMGSFTAGASVRNEKTDSAVGQFLYELRRIADQPASDSEVTSLKNYMSGGFARSLENPGTIASFALNVARYNLPKDYYRNYLTRLAAVSPAQVQQMARQYVPYDNPTIVIVGNAKEIAPGLEKYGEVKYFDIYGNPVAAPEVKAVSGDIKAEDILRKALNAYGSESDRNALKDLTLTGKVSMMGQQLDFVQKYILPTGFSSDIQMGGMSLMKQQKNGDSYSATMQGMQQPVDEAGKAELDAQAAYFSEQYYLSKPGYSFVLKGIEKVEGKDAYAIEINGPGGSKSMAYYDVASGLKIQDTRTQDAGPMGTLNVVSKVLEYKTYNGVQIPVRLQVNAGPIAQDITITDVKVNTGLKASEL